MTNNWRKKYLFDPEGKRPMRLSRSKVDLFRECPRCFYFDRRLGVSRPGIPAFSLNNAVDILLKKEFDIHRAKQTKHSLLTTYGIDALPLEHPSLDHWRDALRGGVTYAFPGTNLVITGGIDDIWVDEDGKLLVVEYKATATDKEISLDDKWKQNYKRQVEFYQWLLRKNDFAVSNTAYFVFCNGTTDREAFDGKLEFDVTILPYEGSDAWVEGTIQQVHECLLSDTPPPERETCEYCAYREAWQAAESRAR